MCVGRSARTRAAECERPVRRSFGPGTELRLQGVGQIRRRLLRKEGGGEKCNRRNCGAAGRAPRVRHEFALRRLKSDPRVRRDPLREGGFGSEGATRRGSWQASAEPAAGRSVFYEWEVRILSMFGVRMIEAAASLPLRPLIAVSRHPSVVF